MKIPTKVARVEWTFFEHFCRVLETRHTAKLNNTRQNFRAGARTSWWGSLPCVRNLTHGKWRILLCVTFLPCVLLACARQIGTFAVCEVFAVCLLLRHTAKVLFAVCCLLCRVFHWWHTAKALFAVCPISSSRQRTGHTANVLFPVVPPDNIGHLLGPWHNGYPAKLKKQLLLGASVMCWAIWLCRNDGLPWNQF